MSEWTDVAPAPSSSYHPNVAKFLGVLGQAEGAGYGTIVGGSEFNNYAAHPRVVGLRTAEGPSTAAGRYQITKSTYDDTAKKLGINDFSPASQDKIAIQLIKDKGAYEDVVRGDYNSAMKKLGGVWASLPSSKYSQPKLTQEQFNKMANQDDGWTTVAPAMKQSPSSDDGWTTVAPAATTPKVATTEAPKQATANEAPKKEEKSWLRTIDDAVRGVADTLTFGYADEIAAKMDQLTGGGQSGKKTYEEALAAQRKRDSEGGGARLAGQVTGALLPGSNVLNAVRAPANATRLGRAAVGAGTGAVQGALYGSGSAEDDRLQGAVDGALLGGATGGVLGGVMPTTAGQIATKLEKKAGDPKSAAMDAEIIQDLGKIAQNPNLRGNEVRAKLANALENRYYSQVERLTKKLSDEDLAKLGTSRDKIESVIGTAGERNIVSQEALQQLRGNKVGDALADAVEKAQRTASLTQQVTSSPLLSPVRHALGVVTPEWVARSVNTALGGKKDRVNVIQNYLKPKMLEAAQELQSRTGPSAQTQSRNALESLVTQKQKAAEALAQRQAQQQVEAQAAQQVQKAQTLADNATARQNMGMRGSPLSGSYATTLEYSGATNEQAIPVLRQLVKDNKGTEIGKAAKQLLKSDPRVENSPAFYAVQGILKDVVQGGALTDVTAKAANTVGKIGGNNPASKIVKGLDDATVASLVGRTEDMSGKPINGARKYLVGKIANILDDQKNGNALDQEALDLLKAIGM